MWPDVTPVNGEAFLTFAWPWHGVPKQDIIVGSCVLGTLVAARTFALDTH